MENEISKNTIDLIWYLGNCCMNLFDRYSAKLSGFPNIYQFIQDYYQCREKWVKYNDGFYFVKDGKKDIDTDYLSIIAKYCDGTIDSIDLVDSVNHARMAAQATLHQVDKVKKEIYDTIYQLYRYFVDNKLYMYDEYNEKYNDIYHLHRKGDIAIDVLKMSKTLLGVEKSRIHNAYIGQWIPMIMFEESEGNLTIFADNGYNQNLRRMSTDGQLEFDTDTLLEIMEMLNNCKNKIHDLERDLESLNYKKEHIESMIGKKIE